MADINNLTELKNAASTGGAYTIAPGTYILDADLTFGTDITITHDNTAGHVVIDGSDSFRVIIQNCTAEFTGQDDSKRIQFTQGDADSVTVQSTSAAVDLVFNYCDFSEAATGDGLAVSGALSGVVKVTLNNCKIYNNDWDGISALDSATGQDVLIYLNNCEAYGQDPTAQGGVAGDGITAHKPNQHIFINGGSSHDNGKGGVAIVGNATAFITGAELHDNNKIVDVGSLEMTNAFIVMFDTKIYNDVTSTKRLAKFVGGRIIMVNCDWDGSNCTGSYMIWGQKGTGGELLDYVALNCVFRNHNVTGWKYAIAATYDEVGGLIKNCVFYNNGACCFNIDTPNLTFINNVFMGTGNYALVCSTAYEYDMNILNGYNCFYNNVANFYHSSLKPTDIEDDPQFVDAENDDFRLKTSSPCLNTGKSTLHNGYASIGSWQRSQAIACRLVGR